MKGTTFLKNMNLLRVFQATLVYIPIGTYFVITDAYHAAQKGH